MYVESKKNTSIFETSTIRIWTLRSLFQKPVSGCVVLSNKRLQKPESEGRAFLEGISLNVYLQIDYMRWEGYPHYVLRLTNSDLLTWNLWHVCVRLSKFKISHWNISSEPVWLKNHRLGVWDIDCRKLLLNPYCVMQPYSQMCNLYEYNAKIICPCRLLLSFVFVVGVLSRNLKLEDVHAYFSNLGLDEQKCKQLVSLVGYRYIFCVPYYPHHSSRMEDQHAFCM